MKTQQEFLSYPLDKEDQEDIMCELCTNNACFDMRYIAGMYVFTCQKCYDDYLGFRARTLPRVI